MGANCLEHRNDIQLACVTGNATGKNGAAVYKYTRAVHARHGHNTGRHVFVTPTNSNKAVHAFAADDGLNGVRNYLAAYERVLHPFSAHGDAIRNSDGVEDNGLAAGFVGAALRFLCEQINVHVARGDVAPSGGNADHGLLKITGLETGRVEHCAGGRTVRAIEHDGRMRAEIRLFLVIPAHERQEFSR